MIFATKFFPKVPFWKSLLANVTSHSLTRVTVVEVAAKSLFTASSLVAMGLRRCFGVVFLLTPVLDTVSSHIL